MLANIVSLISEFHMVTKLQSSVLEDLGNRKREIRIRIHYLTSKSLIKSKRKYLDSNKLVINCTTTFILTVSSPIDRQQSAQQSDHYSLRSADTAEETILLMERVD